MSSQLPPPSLQSKEVITFHTRIWGFELTQYVLQKGAEGKYWVRACGVTTGGCEGGGIFGQLLLVATSQGPIRWWMGEHREFELFLDVLTNELKRRVMNPLTMPI